MKPPDPDHGTVSMADIEVRRKEIVKALEDSDVPIDLVTCLTIVVLGQSLEEEGFVVDVLPNGPGLKVH